MIAADKGCGCCLWAVPKVCSFSALLLLPFVAMLCLKWAFLANAFSFLWPYIPPEEKALLFAQNFKLVLESLGEGCFLQSVSVSLSLLFLCVGWGRQTLPWHWCVLKISYCDVCQRRQSRIYILQVVYCLQGSWAQEKKLQKGAKIRCCLSCVMQSRGLPTGLASWFVQTPHVKLSCETSHGMTTFMDASSVMKLRNPLTRRKNNIH